MKSAMPYYGVPSPVQAEIWRDVFPRFQAETLQQWRDAALALWRGARFREERYAALAWTGQRPYRRYQTPAVLPLYEEFIVSGEWWDYAESDREPAGAGPILASHPRPMAALMRRWSRDQRSVEAPDGNPGATGVQGQDGSRLALRVHRTESRRSCVSSSEKRSAGRCASMRGPTRVKWQGTCGRIAIA